MATYIAIVQVGEDNGYTVSFPDFPGCAVDASTIDEVIAKARGALVARIERLLESGEEIGWPSAAGSLHKDDASIFVAVDVPDDLRIANIALAVPALTMARIDSFARRHNLTRAALFVEAVDRWAAQENSLGEGSGAEADGPRLSDFGNPLELKVDQMADVEPCMQADGAHGGAETAGPVDDVTAELARLLEGAPEKRVGAAEEAPERSVRKAK